MTRSSIVLSLQEWIRRIEEQIEELYENKQFYEQIIKEFQDGTNIEDNLSSFGTIEFIQEPRQPQRQIRESDFKQASNKTKSKKQERQEGLERARAWHLDRTRAQKNKKK
jgi:hypothetical protein